MPSNLSQIGAANSAEFVASVASVADVKALEKSVADRLTSMTATLIEILRESALEAAQDFPRSAVDVTLAGLSAAISPHGDCDDERIARLFSRALDAHREIEGALAARDRRIAFGIEARRRTGPSEGSIKAASDAFGRFRDDLRVYLECGSVVRVAEMADIDKIEAVVAVFTGSECLVEDETASWASHFLAAWQCECTLEDEPFCASDAWAEQFPFLARLDAKMARKALAEGEEAARELSEDAKEWDDHIAGEQRHLNSQLL